MREERKVQKEGERDKEERMREETQSRVDDGSGSVNIELGVEKKGKKERTKERKKERRN
jgi:hypothetical protein